MPPRNRNRRRSGRRPNVFVQTERPAGRPENADDEANAPVAEPSPVLAATTAAVARQRPSGRRTQRTRSEVYARTFPREIRKMAILSVGIVIALAVFTIVL